MMKDVSLSSIKVEIPPDYDEIARANSISDDSKAIIRSNSINIPTIRSDSIAIPSSNILETISSSPTKIDSVSSPPPREDLISPPRSDSITPPPSQRVDIDLSSPPPRSDSAGISDIVVVEPEEPVLEPEEEVTNIPESREKELWVPAYAHPEVNPADFKSWLSSRWEEDSVSQPKKPHILRRSSSFLDSHVVVFLYRVFITRLMPMIQIHLN
jgi:hypothetical protein